MLLYKCTFTFQLTANSSLAPETGYIEAYVVSDIVAETGLERHQEKVWLQSSVRFGSQKAV